MRNLCKSGRRRANAKTPCVPGAEGVDGLDATETARRYSLLALFAQKDIFVD